MTSLENLIKHETDKLQEVIDRQRRELDSRDAQIAALRQRVEDQAITIKRLQMESNDLEYFHDQNIKDIRRKIDPKAKLNRAKAQFKQLFPDIQFNVQDKNP